MKSSPISIFSIQKLLLLPLIVLWNDNSVHVNAADYDVDYSFPMKKHTVVNDGTLPNRQAIYDEYLQGCRDKYNKVPDACNDSENGRIDMNVDQPPSMQNYTDLGFKKIKTPTKVWNLLQEFWKNNDPTGDIHGSKPENWSKGNSYANHWVSPTYMVSVEDTSLRGGGYVLKDAIWDAAKSTLQEWTGEELQPCSLYGIRIYTEGAILATHVDRLPLVSSAIVNVAQDVDEDWPIEVIGHDGRAHNITMQPGDMVLYESHSVLHGRPFALKGRYFANVFIHFEPTGHSLRHHAKMELDTKDPNAKYREAVRNGHGGHENDADSRLPSYIIKGTKKAEEWLKNNPEKDEPAQLPETVGQTVAHAAVQRGDTKTLLDLIAKKGDIVHARDVNGWTPLHEAVRTGSVSHVKVLVENGANVNEKTNSGATPLSLAKSEHGNDHPVIDFLLELGAVFDGPEL